MNTSRNMALFVSDRFPFTQDAIFALCAYLEKAGWKKLDEQWFEKQIDSAEPVQVRVPRTISSPSPIEALEAFADILFLISLDERIALEAAIEKVQAEVNSKDVRTRDQPFIEVVIHWDILHFIVHSKNMTVAENWRELEAEAQAAVEAAMLDRFEQWWVGALVGRDVSNRPSTLFACPDDLAARAVFSEIDVTIAAVAGHYIVVSPAGIASNWKELEPEARAFVLPRIVERWEPWWARRWKEEGELPNEMFRCPFPLASRATFAPFQALSIDNKDREIVKKAERSRRRFYPTHLETSHD